MPSRQLSQSQPSTSDLPDPFSPPQTPTSSPPPPPSQPPYSSPRRHRLRMLPPPPRPPLPPHPHPKTHRPILLRHRTPPPPPHPTASPTPSYAAPPTPSPPASATAASAPSSPAPSHRRHENPSPSSSWTHPPTRANVSSKTNSSSPQGSVQATSSLRLGFPQTRNDAVSSSFTTSCKTGHLGVDQSPTSPETMAITASPEMGLAMAASPGFDKASVQSEKDVDVVGGFKRNGKGLKSNSVRDWWWKHDNEVVASGLGSTPVGEAKKVKDYVMEWLGREKKIKSRSRNNRGSVDWWLEGFSGELWRARRNSFDSVSGEIPKSGGVSSTPSMRGTVCYVAPEYGYGGEVSEKCDVYSFGVLLLVIISGRRPLQVTGSPMSEFQRANLLSWARHCARNGKLIELVDQSIQSLDKEQALLCIKVALLCLLKIPARRPSMKEVVGMLSGELEPPQLPVEYSPSTPNRFPFKSRKKVR
ncbi:Protein kinase domain [Sesbania bispinosa]|nr:Protein kinase domain [Sesbania bispinosa]